MRYGSRVTNDCEDDGNSCRKIRKPGKSLRDAGGKTGGIPWSQGVPGGNEDRIGVMKGINLAKRVACRSFLLDKGVIFLAKFQKLLYSVKKFTIIKVCSKHVY